MTDLLAAYGPPAHRPLAVRLRQSRELAGLTLEQASAASGLSVSDLTDLESGRRRPLPAHIDELSRAYGVDLAGLLVARGAVTFDRATGRLAIDGQERHVSEPADAEDVYTAYLALLYAVRRASPGQRVALRADDIDVLVSVVGEDGDRIEQRLVALMGSTAQEASLVARAVRRERAKADAPDDGPVNDGARSTDPLSALARRLDTRTATVAVVGLGYVGLPLLLAAAAAGHPIIGYDVSASKVADLGAGRSYIADISDGELGVLADAVLTADPAALADADVVLLAVPTPLSDGSPDLRPVRAATEALARVLRPGTLVVLESTTWPGTTEEVLLPLLEADGRRVGIDFALAYSPERIDPGSDHAFATTPKLIAGVTEVCTRLAGQFYSALVNSVVVTKSPRDAEMAKLIENTFRQVNIALVNELATIAPALGVDIWAALDAASTKPFGFMPFWPGPGVGGHCIAVDPSYLSWRAEQQLGYRIGFIEHARNVNNRMPDYVGTRVAEVLNRMGRAVRGSRIHLLGLAYKPGVNDARESPAIAVAERLLRDGAELSYTDAFLPKVDVSGVTLLSTEVTEGLLDDVDVAVVLTAHSSVDYGAVLAGARVVFDATGTLRRHEAAVADGRLVLL